MEAVTRRAHGHRLEDDGGPGRARRGEARRQAPRCATRSATSGSTSPTTELGEAVSEVARGLIDLGLEHGDKVSILSHTRPEWTYANFAILAAGAVSVSIYQTNSAEECHYVLEHSESRAVFVEDAEQLAKVREVQGDLPNLEHIIIFDPVAATSATRSRSTTCASAGAARDAAELEARTRRGRPGRHRASHLHLGHHRPAEGLPDQPRQLPRRHDDDRVDGRARGGRRRLPLPPARARVREADPVRRARPRRRDRLLGEGPAEDHPQPRWRSSRPTSRRCRGCSRRSTRSPPATRQDPEQLEQAVAGRAEGAPDAGTPARRCPTELQAGVRPGRGGALQERARRSSAATSASASPAPRRSRRRSSSSSTPAACR